MRKAVFCLLIFLTALLSCSSIDCPVETKVQVRYGFYKTGETVDTLADTLSVWTTRNNGTDTLIFNRAFDRTSIQLPISYQHPEDILYFHFTDSNKVLTVDTVWLQKDDIPHFESIDCAAHYFHTLTAVHSTHHRIDTLIINNPSVNYESTVEHIRIQFKAHH
jgi:hypothetical protein